MWRWGIGAGFWLLISVATAAPEHPLLTSPTVAPADAESVPWVAPPAAPRSLDPARAMEDPAALVRYLEANQGQLDVGSMANEGIARAVAQVLLRADKTFMAEGVLAQAVARWPQSVELRRARGRVLISLGRPAVAQAELGKVVLAAPNDPTARYLLGLAWLRVEPRSPETDAQAVAAFEKVLELAPRYRDPDGMTAMGLREAVRRMRAPKK